MIRVKREYGNGLTAEVEGKDMKEVLMELARADELFYDIRAWGKDETGKTVGSDRVKFIVRHTKDGDQYFEQMCVEGPLKFYKRHIGEFKERKGDMYVAKGPPKDPTNHVLGFAGWSKYVKPEGQYGDQQYNQDTQYQQRPQQPQQQRSQPTQQAAPQQQYNPHAAPPQQYQPSQSSMEDIPF
jgi:hypothetical protein